MAEIDLVETEDQASLRETLREFFAEQAPLERLREGCGDGAQRSSTRPSGGVDRKVWAGVAELGLPAMIIPEEHGGLGQSAREAWVMFTEAGRGLYGGPLLSGVAATRALLLADDSEACAEYLPGIADGSTIATLALDADGSARDVLGGVEAVADGDRWTLSGAKTAVLAGQAADLLLVSATSADGPGLFAVSGESEGVSATALETLDLSRPLARVDLDAAPARRIAGADASTITAVLDRLLVDLAAEQAGGAGACLDMSVEYAKTRTQFDRPIGQFQAVAHLCVDMLARVERARAASQYAAAADAAGSSEFAVAARVAAAYCGRAFREVTTATIHVHGGTGFTWEHDAHLFHRRAWSTEHLFGAAGVHHDEVATRLGL